MTKWAIRRYRPYPVPIEDKAAAMFWTGKLLFDEWSEVIHVLNTIVGPNNVQAIIEPEAPLLIPDGDDVILISRELDL